MRRRGGIWHILSSGRPPAAALAVKLEEQHQWHATSVLQQPRRPQLWWRQQQARKAAHQAPCPVGEGCCCGRNRLCAQMAVHRQQSCRGCTAIECLWLQRTSLVLFSSKVRQELLAFVNRYGENQRNIVGRGLFPYCLWINDLRLLYCKERDI